ncbi:hypothetical protein [Fischerella thermalis]|uniref:hypothetical protein n=1 Tax=Fischerella thermalis TaxID=372787 RepID=UPI0015E1226C|nr:hypothetical protein [Fischerella thermalis]
MHYYVHPFQLELHKLENMIVHVQHVNNQEVKQIADSRLFTSQAIGEEGGDTVTTKAIGEEGGDTVTTKAIGEEGGDTVTTKAVGEEGGDTVTTLAFGEEGGF